MKPTGLPKKQRPKNIQHIEHDPITNDLHVTFHNGDTYTYNDVSPQDYTNLLKAPSLGQHFHAKIKPKHNYTKQPRKK